MQSPNTFVKGIMKGETIKPFTEKDFEHFDTEKDLTKYSNNSMMFTIPLHSLPIASAILTENFPQTKK